MPDEVLEKQFKAHAKFREKYRKNNPIFSFTRIIKCKEVKNVKK